MSSIRDWVTFCIPVLPKSVASDWGIVVELLKDTLNSLSGQIDRRFSVIIAGHELPIVPGDYNFRIEFLQADWQPKSENNDKLRDKRWKREMLYRQLRAEGSGYAMLLDADDLVSNQLVQFVLNDKDPNGYVIESGYALDRINHRIAPIPGAWSGNFDTVCGSCCIIYFNEDDLPAVDNKDDNILSSKLKRHSEWKIVMADAGRPLKSLPFRGAVYVLNHSQNLHSSINSDREVRVPLAIQRKSTEFSDEIKEEFGIVI